MITLASASPWWNKTLRYAATQLIMQHMIEIEHEEERQDFDALNMDLATLPLLLQGHMIFVRHNDFEWQFSNGRFAVNIVSLLVAIPMDHCISMADKALLKELLRGPSQGGSAQLQGTATLGGVEMLLVRITGIPDLHYSIHRGVPTQHSSSVWQFFRFVKTWLGAFVSDCS